MFANADTSGMVKIGRYREKGGRSLLRELFVSGLLKKSELS